MTAETVAVTLVAVSLWAVSEPPRPPGRITTIHLRVFAHAAIDSAALALARSTASRLLDSAGIAIGWQDCGSGEDTCGQTARANEVVVLLMPTTKLTQDDAGGEALHGGSTPLPTVLVYLPNLEDRLRSVHQSAAGRSNPALASLQMGHLVGLAIAHEVGHCFGLSHALSGVMKARIGPDDLLALATSRLALTSEDAAALRQSVEARAIE